MTRPSDAELMAFADGELDEAAAREVEAVIARDPKVAAIVEGHRRTRAAAREAMDRLASAGMSPGLKDLADRLAMDNVARLPAASKSRDRGAWPLAAAACLAVGVFAGSLIFRGGDELLRWRNGPAPGPVLVRALETVPSGEPTAMVHVLASFAASNGRYCRQFELMDGAAGGVACREAGGWVLETVVRRSGEPGAYAAAGGEDPIAVAVVSLGPGPRLDGATERALIDRGWKD